MSDEVTTPTPYRRNNKGGTSRGVHRPKSAKPRVRPGEGEARRAARERAKAMPRYKAGKKKGKWKKRG